MVGGSPTEAGELPALPLLRTHSRLGQGPSFPWSSLVDSGPPATLNLRLRPASGGPVSKPARTVGRQHHSRWRFLVRFVSAQPRVAARAPPAGVAVPWIRLNSAARLSPGLTKPRAGRRWPVRRPGNLASHNFHKTPLDTLKTWSTLVATLVKPIAPRPNPSRPDPSRTSQAAMCIRSSSRSGPRTDRDQPLLPSPVGFIEAFPRLCSGIHTLLRVARRRGSPSTGQ